MNPLQKTSVAPKSAQQIPSLSGREAFAAAFAVAAEGLVGLAALTADGPLLWPVVLHFVVTAITAAILFVGRQSAYDPTVSSLIVLVILVSGPVGALASLVALAFLDHAGAGPDVLEAWYTRLAGSAHSDPPTELSDRVIAGRVMASTAPPPVSYEEVIASGTLGQCQAALGLMARRFHTDYTPALEAALRSREPVVRVQAAAVVSRVRMNLKSRIKKLTSPRARTSAQRVAAAAELARLSGCAFVDRADAARCREAAADALGVALATSRDVYAQAAQANRETARVIERHLLSNARHRDFRVSRRIHTLVVDRRLRLRLTARQAAP